MGNTQPRNIGKRLTGNTQPRDKTSAPLWLGHTESSVQDLLPLLSKKGGDGAACPGLHPGASALEWS